MIGRGCYGRPWFPAQAAHFLRTGERLPEPSLARQKSILLGHYHAMLSQFGYGPGARLARKHLSWYSRGLPGSAEFRATMNRLPDANTVIRLIDRFYDPLIARGLTRWGGGPPGSPDPTTIWTISTVIRGPKRHECGSIPGLAAFDRTGRAAERPRSWPTPPRYWGQCRCRSSCSTWKTGFDMLTMPPSSFSGSLPPG